MIQNAAPSADTDGRTKRTATVAAEEDDSGLWTRSRDFDWGDLVWSNYKTATNPDFLPIFLRSVMYALVSTIACVRRLHTGSTVGEARVAIRP